MPEESRAALPPSAILREAQQLHNVRERLDTLGDQYPLVSEALITISGNVRHTAALLDVLVLTKMGTSFRNWVRQMPDLLIFCRHGVMSHREQILCATRGNIFMMMKKKNRIEIAKKIISSVKREMQKPRLTESVRNDGRDQAAAVVVVVADPRARFEKA
jgi:hypothetical protein